MDYPVTVEGSALPAPSYQWQQLVTKEINVTTNETLVKRDDGNYVRLRPPTMPILRQTSEPRIVAV